MEFWAITRSPRLRSMILRSIPDHVAIGGVDAQAQRLAEEAERAASMAQSLVLSLLRGDSAWRKSAPGEPVKEVSTWPRSATGW